MSSEKKLSEAKRLLLQQRLKRKIKPKKEANVLEKRPTGTPKLASIGQSRIWLLDRLEEGSASNNVTSSFHILSDLDIEALGEAIEKVVERHEILRSCYKLVGDQLTQKPTTKEHRKLERYVCDGKNPAMKQAQDFGRLPIDIENGPLYRVGLFTENDNSHVLILSVHDIGFDKWSLLVFWREVQAIYSHLTSDLPLALEEPRYQFSDFAYWQRNWFTKEKETEQADYWRKKLQNPPQPIPLPTDHAYPPALTTEGRLEYGRIDSETTNGLKKLAAKNNASTFSALLLAFSVLLSKYSQTNDILVSSPVANRRKKETADLIGFFLNTLVIRSNFDQNPNFLEALSDTKNSVSEALEHQDLPTDKIVELIKPQRIKGRHPLFQTMFVFQREDEGTPKLQLPGCKIEPIFLETKTSKFDLSLFIAEQGDAFKTVLEYRTDLFEAASIQRLLKHFETLLKSIVANPNCPVHDLPFLNEQEIQKLQCFENGPELIPSESETVLDLIARHKNSDTFALSGNGTSYTFKEFHALSNHIAALLRKKNLDRNDSIALYLERSPEAIIALFGILKANCRYISIDVDYPKKRVEQLFAGARPQLSICSESSAPTCPLEARNILRINEILKDSEHEQNSIDPIRPIPNDFAYTIFTSGSSGNPKGVSVTHGNLMASTLARLQYYENNPKRFLLIPSLSFDSSVAGVFWTLSVGSTLIIPSFDEIRDPDLLTALIEHERIDSILAVPSLVEQLLRWNAARLSALKILIVAGEACSSKLVELHQTHLPNTSLYNEYGPTEATVWATAYDFPNESNKEDIPIGKPIPGVKVKILDTHRRRVPIGFKGEIAIAGPGVTNGYDNLTELTAERFFEGENQQRFYATGDLARWNDKGDIVYLGRADEQVKINGYRIEVGEIESALRKIEGVKDASVLALPSHLPVEQDLRTLEELLSQVDELSLDKAIEEVSDETVSTSGNHKKIRRLSREKIDVALTFKTDAFISPPRKAQRDWLIAQAINEVADDLEHLDKITPSFVPGKDHKLDRDLIDITNAKLEKDSIMEDWQTPIMKQMASYATESHGDLLEIGFGLGVSASFVQDFGVKSHTIVEMNSPCIENHYKPWRTKYPASDIRLHHARWQDALKNLGLFDGILFHAFPMNEEEFVEYVLNSVTFAEHAFEPMAKHLKQGGIFTYLTTEIDSLSRRHQRALLNHFSEVTYRPIQLTIPSDTIDTWWAQSMIAIKATK